MFYIGSGEIQEPADDLYGSISDATSPNEAMYNALSDGEIQVSTLIIHAASQTFLQGHLNVTWLTLTCYIAFTFD